MKRVFPVALAIGLLVLGMSAMADKETYDKPAGASTKTTTTTTTSTQDKACDVSHVTKMSALTWKEMEGYPAGCKVAEVDAIGTVGMVYLKLPKGSKIAPHTHPGEHWGTVVSGNGTFGIGTDAAAGKDMSSGDFFHMPPKEVHWVTAKSDMVVAISGTGEPGIDYVNASDDPRKGQAGSK